MTSLSLPMLEGQNESMTKPLGVAERLLWDLDRYDFPLESVSHYDTAVRSEIKGGIEDMRRIRSIRTKFLLRPMERRLRHVAVHEANPIERDQAVWQLATTLAGKCVHTLGESAMAAPTPRLAISALLALQKCAHEEPREASAVLQSFFGHRNVEVSEWAKLIEKELAICEGRAPLAELSQPVSNRELRIDPNARFDVTMPLVFRCDAYTRVGPVTWHTVISPEWFRVVFGDAMALVRRDSFMSNLVLEKSVPGLHADGSPHYEHFPFSGVTEQLEQGVYQHNYWASLHRPFYTSGRTELVLENRPVLQRVAMSFCRLAVTATPERYGTVAQRPVPESVRGIFFGYGHVEPQILVKNRLSLRAGEFQLSSRHNPHTGDLANTYFHGTFFGKLQDLKGDGRIDVNTVPVHCDASGRLDYSGDGSYAKDPVRPDDWE